MNAEQALFGLLLEIDSIEKLVLEGFRSEYIPNEELRQVYDFAIDYWHKNGAVSAPTAVVFKETRVQGHGGIYISDLLAQYHIHVDTVPEESVEWVIEELRAGYLTRVAADLITNLAIDITEASASERLGAFSSRVSELVQVSLTLQPRRTVFEMRSGADELLDQYQKRVDNRGVFSGMHIGLPEVDDHVNGIQQGELMVLAAPAKGSKSYMIDRIALKEFEEGRTVCLFTLENSIELTRDRIACLATGVHPKRWEQGEATDFEVDAMREWINDELKPKSDSLWILKPDLASRRPEHMVMTAQIYGADTLLIDQLSFVEAADPRAARYLQVREIMHTLKGGISTGSSQLACCIAHQINRDGIKAARKHNHLQMYDMADGSEVERTADWVMSMWQGEDELQLNQVLFQILAARRREIKNWTLQWDIQTGTMAVLEEATIG